MREAFPAAARRSTSASSASCVRTRSSGVIASVWRTNDRSTPFSSYSGSLTSSDDSVTRRTYQAQTRRATSLRSRFRLHRRANGFALNGRQNLLANRAPTAPPLCVDDCRHDPQVPATHDVAWQLPQAAQTRLAFRRGRQRFHRDASRRASSGFGALLRRARDSSPRKHTGMVAHEPVGAPLTNRTAARSKLRV